MPAYRDAVREKMAESNVLAKKQGINVNDIRKESRGATAVTAMVSRFVNDSSPTEGHERIYAVDFAGQTFNGTNQDFTLPRRVLGQNILVWHIQQSTGTAVPLTRTTNPAPGGTEYFFDNVFTVRVGTAPQALDGLICAIITEL